ncbi:MAG: bifunctional histidinol-phosphatase/imidazoleglycerol-phosphate dehydratase HisB [Pseudomonadota bacterium]
MSKRVLFIDRDGTLIEEPDDFQVDAVEKVKLVPNVIHALSRLKAAGFRFVMVSNQDGLGTPSFPEAQFQAAQTHTEALFRSQDIEFDEMFFCPHFEHDNCTCRKPATGLLSAYLASTALDTAQCAVIGDRDTDLQLAENLQIRGFKINAETSAQDWQAIADELCLQPRRGTCTRITNETNIKVELALDGDTPVHINTGLGFFDHMLEQIARHASIALRIECSGDLHIDEHHSVEDVALALGEALRKALGDKRGIARYGHSIPMDESRADALLDLSGRAATQFSGEFKRDAVGGMSIEMVRHFFQSLASALGAAIHIQVKGDNAHHMVEACFKAFGRALGQACAREGNAVPSTKGTL